MKENYKLAKWLDNQIPDREMQDLEGFDTYQKIKKISQDLAAPNLNEEKTFQQIEFRNKQQKSNFKVFYKFAAALALLVGVASFSLFFAAKEVVTLSQTQKIELPDQSKIQLAANSQLQYNALTWWFNRDVNLNGKAYFEVEKGSTFNVETPLGLVQVLGTKFEVDATENQFSVRCFEGKVKIVTNQHQEILEANESVFISNKNELKKDFIPYNQPFWTDAHVQLNAADLKKVVKLLEKHFNVEIDISTISKEKQFSGKLSTQDLKENFEIISSTYQFKIEQINNNKYIFVEDEDN